MNVSNILATKQGPVITIRPWQSVREAVALLAQHRIGALVVMDETPRPVGIITERQVVRRLAEDDQIVARTIGDIMTTELVTGTPHDDLSSVAHVMTERRIRHVPIIDNGDLVGIVSIGDVLKAQRDEYRGQAETFETQVLGA